MAPASKIGNYAAIILAFILFSGSKICSSQTYDPTTVPPDDTTPDPTTTEPTTPEPCELRLQSLAINGSMDAITLRYLLDGVSHPMYKYEAVSIPNLRSRFVFTSEGKSHSDIIVSIRVYQGHYLRLFEDMLITTSNATTRQLFRLECLRNNENDNAFHLYLDTSEYNLVTPIRLAPFSFYRNFSYRNEPPAIFLIDDYELSVEESYEGKRENIIPTAELIHNSEWMDKTMAYTELLTLMEEYGHLDGSEISTVADYIVEDVGLEGEVFSKLPPQVQLLFNQGGESGTGLSFYLMHGPGHRMKYYWASVNNENVQPYKFSFNRELRRWGITYADQHQLTFTSNDLVDVLSTVKTYIFEIRFLQMYETTPEPDYSTTEDPIPDETTLELTSPTTPTPINTTPELTTPISTSCDSQNLVGFELFRHLPSGVIQPVHATTLSPDFYFKSQSLPSNPKTFYVCLD